MTGLGTRNWCLAAAAALAVHAAALALVDTPEREGAGDAGPDGMEVVLGTAGGGPEPAPVPTAGPSPAPTVPPEETASGPDAVTVASVFPPTEAVASDRSIGFSRVAPVGAGATAARRSPPETRTVPATEAPARASADAVAATRLPPGAVSNVRPAERSADPVPEGAEEATARAAVPGSRARGRALDRGEAGAAGNYYAAVQAWLERHKRYPRRSRLRGEEGRIVLRIEVTRAGRVADFAIEQGSGHARLDEAAGRMVERAQPLPRMPSGMRGDRVELLVPVEFSLR